MNLLLADLIDKPSHLGMWCCVCGRVGHLNAHHVIPRSQGGEAGPRLRLCGSGTTGCHGEAHEKRLHFRWEHGWEWLATEPMKYEAALELDGWRRIK